MSFLCLGFFLYTTVTGHNRAVTALRDNKEAIDHIQDISIDLTRLVNTMQAYGFKNIEKLHEALQSARPFLEKLPFVGDRLSDFDPSNYQWISSALVEKTEEIEALIGDVEQALIKADAKKLKKYSQDLSDLIHSVREQLKN